MKKHYDSIRFLAVSLDVSSVESIKSLPQRIGSLRKIDILINNAGIIHGRSSEEGQQQQQDLESISRDMLYVFRVNTLGPLLVYECLSKEGANLLADGAKVINITSRMGAMTEPSSGGRLSYRTSKAALNMVTKTLAADYGKNHLFLALHPGYIQTDMTRGRGDMDADEAVGRMRVVIDEKLTKDINGCFYHRDGHPIMY